VVGDAKVGVERPHIPALVIGGYIFAGIPKVYPPGQGIVLDEIYLLLEVAVVYTRVADVGTGKQT
jgi:hypothetical protein